MSVSIKAPASILVPWSPIVADLPALPEGWRFQVWDDSPDLSDVVMAVLPYTFDPAPHRLMAQMPRLAVAQLLTAGYEHALAHLPAGVALHNAKGVHDAATAELAMALILASLRGIDDDVRAMAEGRWIRGFTRSLADSTVLIVGFGAIGQALARRLQGFECEVVPVATTRRVHPEFGPVAAASELAHLLPRADVVVALTPLTEQTRGMFAAEQFALMKPGALLCNMARGPVVNTQDLVAACSAGRIRAALDVTDPEPLPHDHPLWQTPGVIVSPHRAGHSDAFLPRAYALVRAQITAFVGGRDCSHRVA